MDTKPQKSYPVTGSGLGLRRDLLDELEENFPAGVDFMEVAPENWIGIGGKLGKRFRAFTEQVPFITHGLSLSLGSPAPLDETFVQDVKKFLDDFTFTKTYYLSNIFFWSENRILRSDCHPYCRFCKSLNLKLLTNKLTNYLILTVFIFIK